MQPHISYLICSTARTGSLLLAEALQHTGIAGRPREYFAPKLQQTWSERWGILGTSNYADFLDKAIAAGTTPNGVFGARISGHQLESFLLRLQQLPNYKERAVSGVFPNLHY